MARYESDVTCFLRDLFEKQPELRELQQKNRSIHWDKNVDLAAQSAYEAAAASKPPYAYFPLPKAET